MCLGEAKAIAYNVFFCGAKVVYLESMLDVAKGGSLLLRRETSSSHVVIAVG